LKTWRRRMSGTVRASHLCRDINRLGEDRAPRN